MAAWSDRADAETHALIEARHSGEERGFDPDLLSELKEWLLHNVFYRNAHCVNSTWSQATITTIPKSTIDRSPR